MIPLSIAIPTYNRASFLAETLESILPQMREGMELVISDNGSTDDTLSLLKKYQESYPIRVVGFQENQGIDRNIVNAITHSRGKYVQLFADDDLLLPGSIDAIIEEIDRSAPIALCLNHCAFNNDSLEERQPPFLSCKRKVFYSGNAFFKYCGLGFLSSLILRREEAISFCNKVRLGKECAHLDITTRMVLKGEGPYVYRGDVVVAGRALETPRYDLIHSCVIYPKELYNELLEEGLLAPAVYKFLARRLLYKEVPRILYKRLKKAQKTPLKALLKSSFQEFRGGQLLIRTLDFMPRDALLFLFGLVFLGIKILRKLKILIISTRGCL